MSLVRRAVELAARLLPDRDPDPLLGRTDLVQGRALTRLDGPLKVTGQAPFTQDVTVPGLTHAAMVCATRPAGRIATIEVAEAEAAPGVLLVMTHRNAPPMKAPPLLITLKGASFTRAPVMQDDRIRWNGEPVAVVVAETAEQARHAAGLIQVGYAGNGPAPVVDFAAELGRARRAANVQGERTRIAKGDVGRARAAAEHVVDHLYRTPMHYNAAIEPHVTVARWDDADRLTVWDATQAVTHTQLTLAEVFGVPAGNVRVIAKFVGGAFGSKMIWSHQLLCAGAARLLGRPVRAVLTREEVFRVTGGRTPSEQRVTLAANTAGGLAALSHEGTTAIGIDDNGFAEQFTFPARNLYASDTLLVDQHVLELHMPANASMRAPGDSIGSFALECAIDELAERLGVDPVEFRTRLEPDRNPATGRPFSARHLPEALAHGADRFGWDRRDPVPRSTRRGEWWVGHGMAVCNYPYVRMPNGKAAITLRADGRAVVRTAAHEMGMGTATVQAQHAADRLGLPIGAVTFEYGDSAMPAGIPAGGSAQTASIIAAVTAAAGRLVKTLLDLAPGGSVLAGARPRDVELRDGGLYRRDGGPGLPYPALLHAAGRDEVTAEGTESLPLEMMKYSMQSFGAQFCQVRVSEVTGEIRVDRWLGVFDTGRVLNPTTAAGQFRGGIVMGLGQALTEEVAVDGRNGRIMNPSLAHYHVPVHADVPPIDVDWLGHPDPLAPMGGHGVGEIGITGVAAAIANAVHNAAGIRLRSLPMTPARVLPALIEAG
ncbi:xanthine dehydrogenase family protein molybdopterin-binding subunit [Actinoplanes sp. NPDC049265]|uniref:xanthine dehydrogenase family protein molybdopterin-binding subunit n=1 Tax=Actinoplanes sp. NPDC049265 TaxID=3363902 RepID=UPI003714323B